MQHLILKIKPEQLSDIIDLVDREQKLDAINYIADQTPLNEIQALRVIDAIVHDREQVMQIQHEQLYHIPEGLETFQSPTVAIEATHESISPMELTHEPSNRINHLIEKAAMPNRKQMLIVGSIGVILLALLISLFK